MSNKNKSKNKLPIVLLGVVAVLVYLYLNGSFEFLLGEPQLCTDTPDDFRCYCSESNEKLLENDGSFSCNLFPDLPLVSYPIDNWGEARAYAVEQGLISCQGDAYLLNLDLEQPMSGNIVIECARKLSINRKEILWETTFSTDNGAVSKRSCNSLYMETCPGDINLGPVDESIPNQIEGYFCDEGEFNSYVASLSGMNPEVIWDKLRSSCKNPNEENLNSYYKEGSTHWAATIGASGIREDVASPVCGIETNGGWFLGMWGVVIDDDGTTTSEGFSYVGDCFPITPDNAISIYRVENNVCNQYTILESEVLVTDYFTLSDCEDNIIPEITWTNDHTTCINSAVGRYQSTGFEGKIPANMLQWIPSQNRCASTSSIVGSCSDYSNPGEISGVTDCTLLARYVQCGGITAEQYEANALAIGEDCIFGL